VDDVEDRRSATQKAGRTREFEVGDKVFARFWYGTRRGRAGVVLRRGGNATYDVQVGDQLHRRHVTQLLRDVEHGGVTPEDDAAVEAENPVDDPAEPAPTAPAPPVAAPTAQAVPTVPAQPPRAPAVGATLPVARATAPPEAAPETKPRAVPAPAKPKPIAPSEPVRRSRREHRTPTRFDDEYSGKGSKKSL